MQEVWGFFCELDNARSSNGFGVNPISYTEIKCYFDLMGIIPQDIEVKLIKLLDGIALRHYAEEQKKKSKSKSGK